MAWLKFDEGMAHDDRVLALPSDKARWAWVCILLGAKSLRPAGQYSSLAQLRSKCGATAASQVPHLVKVGLIAVENGEVFTIPNWKRWQVDATVGERQARFRAKTAENQRYVTGENRIDKIDKNRKENTSGMVNVGELLRKAAGHG